MEQTTTPTFEYWTAKTVQRVTGYSRVTLWRKSRDAADSFPAPHQLSANRVAWRSDEIAAWQHSRPLVAYAPDRAAA